MPHFRGIAERVKRGVWESGGFPLEFPVTSTVLQRGITDMVRISHARMSGTAFGTTVLHVCPEAAAGGNLALVRDGDFVELDVENRRLHLDVSDEALAARRRECRAPEPAMRGGYQQLYQQHVMQANAGADPDFLVCCRGHAVPREPH